MRIYSLLGLLALFLVSQTTEINADQTADVVVDEA
jgi:hypothetical protein